MIRVQTSFQDTPDDEHFFVLYFGDRPLAEQIDELGLKDGDTVLLWEDDCDFTTEAVLLFDHLLPGMPEPALWARKTSSN